MILEGVDFEGCLTVCTPCLLRLFGSRNGETMPEEKNDLIVVRTYYRCDKCGIGRMHPTGDMFPTDPPQFPHKCSMPSCGNEATFNKHYPTVTYRDKDD